MNKKILKISNQNKLKKILRKKLQRKKIFKQLNNIKK